MSAFPEITVRHARQLLADLDASGVGDMDPLAMAYTIGQLQASVRGLLEVVDEQESSDE